MKFFLISIFCLFSFTNATAQKKVKAACVGNTATAGYLLKDPAAESYPSQLQQLLGSRFDISNFGQSGATLLKKEHNPYYKTDEFKKPMNFNPDIAVIHLGLNDINPRNWPNYHGILIPYSTKI